MTVARGYLSGSVHRWHQNVAMAWTGQTNADHQGRCVSLLFLLNRKPSVALVRHVATHDAGEMDAGDLSYVFKQARPELAADHAGHEATFRQALFGADPALTMAEADWARLIDRLEALCWVLHRNPAEYDRAASGWPAAEISILELAKSLDCGAAVRGLLHDLKGGLW
jgi:hypothetical protein